MRSPVVVLDTNVAASGLSGLHRVPRLGFDAASVVCLEAARAGYIVLVVSEPLLTELERVLQYPAFARSSRIVRQYLRFYRRHSRLVRPQGTLRVLTRDPDDNAVLECALAGRADYLVTNGYPSSDTQWTVSIGLSSGTSNSVTLTAYAIGVGS